MGQAAVYRDVVVTGIGSVLPGARSADELWAVLGQGRSQVGPLPEELSDRTGVYAAAQLAADAGLAEVPGLPPHHSAKYSRDILAVLLALTRSCHDAGLGRTDGCAPERVGLVGSSSRGPVEWLQQRQGGSAIFSSLPGAAVTLGAIHLGAKGLVTSISNACVGGNQALMMAADQIELGRADVMHVVGYEFPLVESVMEVYTAPRTRVLSRHRDRTVRPYDRGRDGFALGEGAVALTLESRAHAEARRARVYAGLAGGLTMNEAAHATRMDTTGGATAAMVHALVDASRTGTGAVDYICGHGTATVYNDLAESRAMAQLYGPRRSTWPPLGSIKPNFGHLLGGAGVLNAAATALMISKQTLAPTINIEDPEPECDHDHVQEGPRSTSVHSAVSLAFAIGSQSSALLLEQAS